MDQRLLYGFIRAYTGASGDRSGSWYPDRCNSRYYDDPAEIEQWKQKAVPDRLDLQPFLYPLDYSQEIRVEVIDETTNSVVYVTAHPKIGGSQ